MTINEDSHGDRPTSPLHILIVEDNPDGRDSLRLLLQLYGFRVDVAEDGLRGVSLALERRPRVALIDIGLPGLDGFQVARRLRAALGGAIVLMACSAYGRQEDRDRAVAVGFDAYFVKPINLDELINRLAEVTTTGQRQTTTAGNN